MAVTRPLLYVSPSATFIGLALTGVALATAPTWIAPSNLRLIAEIFFIFTMAQMWNLLAGYVGLMSFGHQGFVGIGAYSLYVLSNHAGLPIWVCLILSFLTCATVAAAISPLLFRLRDAYFSIGIWVLAEIVRTTFAKTQWLGGITGMSLKSARDIDQQWLTVTTYWWAAALALGSTILLFVLMRTSLGLALMAVRDNDLTAASVGINVTHARFAAFVLSAAGCGLAGAGYYMWAFHVEPDSAFNVNWVVIFLFITVIGGIGTIEGPFIGTLIYFALRQLFAGAGNWYLILMGAVAILAMVTAKGGIWGTLSKLAGFELFSVRRRPPAT